MIRTASNALKLALYYGVVSHFPTSRYGAIFNTIRRAYMSRVLHIMRPHPESRFQDHVYISDGRNLSIGEECQINEYCFIQGAKIGNRVMIAPRVTIYNSSHKINRLDVPMIRQGKTVDVNPTIEDDVWIGINAVILPGVVIRKGCVVGANAVITHSTQPYGVYGGIPARLIHTRTAYQEKATC